MSTSIFRTLAGVTAFSAFVGAACFKVYEGSLQHTIGMSGSTFAILLVTALFFNPGQSEKDKKSKKKNKSKKKPVPAEAQKAGKPKPAAAKPKPAAVKQAATKAAKPDEVKKPNAASGGKTEQKPKTKKSQPKPKKQAAPAKTKHEVVESSDDEDELLFSLGSSVVQLEAASKPSKSAARRQRAKEAKKAFETSSNKSQKPQIDADGFETVVVKKRARKTQAQKQVAAMQQEASIPGETQISVEVAVDPKHYGLLIGPKGATLNKIQETTGVRIEIPDKESEKTTVTVSGSKENTQKAKTAIKSLIEKGFSSITDPNISSASISCPGKALGILIGPGGSNIKKLQAATCTKINTPTQGSGSDKVTISGEKDDVKKCKDAIKMLIQFGFSDLTHEGWTMLVCPFPVDELKTLIGPGGQTIKSIQGDTKCRVNVPDLKRPGSSCDLTICGPAQGAQRAKAQILKLLEKQAAEISGGYDDHDYDSQDEYDSYFN
mmetsp:Transcript_36774/g.72184  ORF Transcript_36774/g.72184 Transcript_36774/m.72184 type:complete len:491 (-) Transcript_36774:319-1791(-)|eukprot:CAMPEP_0175138664 /NCGR_PEP_ID=MMETSP0087-20121206/10477_1 /TAXON_ID=136419 /ORGANISM="Unknown Unknown, Strain D1" /LENGTH=490 /DNA_ID=CAMNT_0016421597 /DNA_START=26 /DNA_END=1498 /DNA_ORIENTATION=-